MILQENIPFATLGSFHIGGPVRFFCDAQSTEEIIEVVSFAHERKLPIFVIGGGTNLLMRDEGFSGLIVRPSLNYIERDKNWIRVGAGIAIKNLLIFTTKHGLSGLEWAGGLPGTVGGAIRGNAGAFGGEIKDSISSVESFNTENGKVVMRNGNECEFGYRSSVFKAGGGREIILAATFTLTPGDQDAMLRAINEKINYRNIHHPMEYPNVGSIFKNIPLSSIPERSRSEFEAVVKKDPFSVVPAAFLISEAGLKGIKRGGAMVSPKHPNFIVNNGHATAKDVRELMHVVKESVEKKFSIVLEEEVMLV